MIPETGQYHKCSNCGYGFRIDGYMSGRGIRIGTPIALGGAYIGAGGKHGNFVTCPNCGNIDAV
ncbi:MAG: hypothetical protein OEW67_09480 [Cyclobacteriaceae bacterium]|nr:hypothetical protein [Cyclobacteriaceae bacterium]